MREIIDEVLNGNYGGETGSIDFSQATMECSVTRGEDLSGSFVIRGEGAPTIKGRVLSTDYRMECLTPDFSGSEAEISYVFHGLGMEPGEVAKGAFRVISNLGEYSLPFVVKCESRVGASSNGPIQSLARFASLAKEHWQEALTFFYSDAFVTLLSENDPEYVTLYRGLSVYRGQEQNMEEFLIHAGKKQYVEFLTESTQIMLELQPVEGEYELLEQEMTVTKSGWGYVALNVEADWEFLVLEKSLLTEEDFLGNYARFPFYVDTARLKEGVNQGKLIFYNSFTSFETEVTVKYGVARVADQARLHRQQAIADVMRQYEKFRTRKIGLSGWLTQTQGLVEKLMALDETDPAP
ncbi:MAG: hypothetical protein IKS85_01455, partial [Lachnospiraceae bacterium]|nr:hypothetical protein [Lachnospiraceae bacterium]